MPDPAINVAVSTGSDGVPFTLAICSAVIFPFCIGPLHVVGVLELC